MSLPLRASGLKISVQPKPVVFVSIWNVLTFICAVIFGFILVFPQQNLREEIGGRQVISAVTATYLQNLLRLYPKDVQLRLLLIEQEIALGELDKAQANMLPLRHNLSFNVRASMTWLNYQFNKQLFYTTASTDPKRPALLSKVRAENRSLATRIKDPQQLLLLAQDALSLNDPQAAYDIYMRLLKTPQLNSGIWLEAAGRTALSVGQYVSSAEFYIAAMKNTSILNQQRVYYKAAINSLLAGSMPEAALKLAMAFYQKSYTNNDMLLYMAHLAVLAGHPEIAQGYLQQLLWPQGNHP